MQFYSYRYIILYPEKYLIILLLPWQLWLLGVALYPLMPCAKKIARSYNQLYFVCPAGEIRFLGHITQTIQLRFIIIIRFKKQSKHSCVAMIIHP